MKLVCFFYLKDILKVCKFYFIQNREFNDAATILEAFCQGAKVLYVFAHVHIAKIMSGQCNS